MKSQKKLLNFIIMLLPIIAGITLIIGGTKEKYSLAYVGTALIWVGAVIIFVDYLLDLCKWRLRLKWLRILIACLGMAIFTTACSFRVIYFSESIENQKICDLLEQRINVVEQGSEEYYELTDERSKKIDEGFDLSQKISVCQMIALSSVLIVNIATRSKKDDTVTIAEDKSK